MESELNRKVFAQIMIAVEKGKDSTRRDLDL
jgi:hypothetical protein